MTSPTLRSSTPSARYCWYGTAPSCSQTTPENWPAPSARPAPAGCPLMSDLADLRGAGWTRLLAAARRKLERSGGLLEGAVGLAGPSDAERRVVISITALYSAEAVKRLTGSLGELDAALRDIYGLGLLKAL